MYSSEFGLQISAFIVLNTVLSIIKIAGMN